MAEAVIIENEPHFSQVIRYCIICGERFDLSRKSDIITRKFCSLSCAAKHGLRDPEAKAKFIASSRTESVRAAGGKSRSGKNNHNWGGGPENRLCQQCGDLFQISRAGINRSKESRGKFCSVLCYHKHSRIDNLNRKPDISVICLQCGKTFLLAGKHTSRAHRRKFCDNTCRAVYGVIHGKKKKTGIEIKLGLVLDDLKIPYKSNFGVEGITVPDFVVEPKTVIYADGDYWHNLIGNKLRDIRINDKLTKLGYKILRFWEHDINDNINAVKDTIEHELCL